MTSEQGLEYMKQVGEIVKQVISERQEGRTHEDADATLSLLIELKVRGQKWVSTSC